MAFGTFNLDPEDENEELVKPEFGMTIGPDKIQALLSQLQSARQPEPPQVDVPREIPQSPAPQMEQTPSPHEQPDDYMQEMKSIYDQMKQPLIPPEKQKMYMVANLLNQLGRPTAADQFHFQGQTYNTAGITPEQFENVAAQKNKALLAPAMMQKQQLMERYKAAKDMQEEGFKSQANKNKLALDDPNSKQSKQMQATTDQLIDKQMLTLGLTEKMLDADKFQALKDSVLNYKQQIPSMSSNQLKSLQDLIMKQVDDVKGIAHDVATNKLAEANLGRQSQNTESEILARQQRHQIDVAELSLRQQQLELAKQKALQEAGKNQLHLTKPQEKLVREIDDLGAALAKMNDLSDIKKKVNTGFAAGNAQKGLSLFDLSSDAFNDLDTQIAQVFNQKTKSIAGSAVSEKEWERIKPQIPLVTDDDNRFNSKINRAIKETQDLIARRTMELQRSVSGNPLDTSQTAANASEMANRIQQGEPIQQAFEGTVNKVSGYKKPVKKPVMAAKDKQALDWANSHPNDPRAAAIKQRLGVK